MGGRRERVHPSDFLDLVVGIPPRQEQERIVDLLGAMDDLIAALAKERVAADAALTTACRLLTNPSAQPAVLPLAEVCEVLDRLRLPINEEERKRRVGDVPYFGANGQVGWIDQPIFNEALVLLAEDGGPVDEWRTRPQAYAVDGPAWVNNHAHVLRATKVSRDWLYYSLRHYDLTALAAGGTRSKLTQAKMREIKIGVPDRSSVVEARLRDFETLVQTLAEEHNRLATLRNSLLGALLAGVVALPESGKASFVAAGA